MHVVPVSDPADARLRDYVGLTDVVLRRVSEPACGLYLAESAKVIERALDAGHRPRSVLLQQKWLEELSPLLEPFDVPVYLAEPEVLEAVTGFVMHRGAIASMHRPPLLPVADLLAGARRVVVLEDIVDHTNVGAIFRAVAGLGADAVLITPRCADPYYRRAVRVSMGTVLQSRGPGSRSGRVAPSSSTSPGSRSRRSPSTRAPSPSPSSRSIRRTGSRCCSGQRATG